MGFLEKIKDAWNVFMSPDSYIRPVRAQQYYQYSATTRDDRPRFSPRKDRTIAVPVFNKISMDVSSLKFQHIVKDNNGNMVDRVFSALDECLSVEANLDQNYRDFIQDIVMSLLDEGCVAVVPIDTSTTIQKDGFDILSMRTAKIIQWYPRHVMVRVYNDKKGIKEDIVVPKEHVAIIENPLYSVINEPNSTLQRLLRKLQLMDATDDKNNSGNLNMIIQLPYVVRSEKQKQQAEERRKELENQLVNSKYGIAYTDGSEKVVQLGHPIENKLLEEIEYLTSHFYSQIGMTPDILNGTANEDQLTQYYERTITPICESICAEFTRKFILREDRLQGQCISCFRDPFKIASLSTITKAADVMCRNEIMTSNEIRQKIGMMPSSDPKADMLINSNMPYQPAGLQEQENVQPNQENIRPNQAVQEYGYDPYTTSITEQALNDYGHDPYIQNGGGK